MDTNNKILFYCTLLILTVSCNQGTPVVKKSGDGLLSGSVSYKPASFAENNRAEEIKQLAPDIHRLIEEHSESGNIPGIAYGVVVDNELVVASATGFANLEKSIPATTKSSFRIASMTKSFTAMAILKLRDEGKISLNDPVSAYIPEMSGLEYLTSDSPEIDIENLLTMTAGFPEDNPWGDRQLDESDQMLIGLVADGISFSNPSSFQYEYSNTGFALLGNIITRVSGIPYQEYIHNNILQPLGMNNTYWEFSDIPDNQLVIGYRWEDGQWKTEPILHDGSFGAMGGLITTIEDFSKYVSFHLSAWPPRNEPDNGPVKRSTLREMHTPQFARLYANETDFNGNSCPIVAGYGYGLGISTDCNNVRWISHGGALPGFGSSYVFFPDYGIGLMAFGNLTYTSPWPLSELRKLLFEKTGLEPRQLPVSDILIERQEQIVRMIQTWDTALESKILAENFYPDRDREKRMSEIKEILDKAGAIVNVNEIDPLNQLRGSFSIITEKGKINVFFTLTPEKNPKVQHLSFSFRENQNR